MSNTGKSLTNVSFRAKILAVIDKLKDQDKTALVHHVDDFEALNKDTFEAGMNALVDAIPAGGGGGGGGGDAVYTVTFNMNANDEITCDKDIDDIISHADEHIVGRFIIEGMVLDPSVNITINIYCDNMKFDYQALNTDDPSMAPMVSTYTYLGFVSDGGVLQVLHDAPLMNEGPEYYKTYIKIAYMFADENPHWEFFDETLGDIVVNSTDVHINGNENTFDPTTDVTKKYVLRVTSMSSSDKNAFLEKSGVQHYERYLLRYLMPPEYTNYSDGQTALFSPLINFANGVQTPLYSKALQLEIEVDKTSYLIPSRDGYSGIFTVGKIRSYYQETNGIPNAGDIDLYADEYDTINNKLIRHIIRMYIYLDSSRNFQSACDYTEIEIPYTVRT